MKLNFWQWIGLGLLVIAVVLVVRRKAMDTGAPTTPNTTAPSTAM